MNRTALLALVFTGTLLSPVSGLAQISCTRGGLQNAVDLYIEAQTRGDKSLLPLANGLGYYENGRLRYVHTLTHLLQAAFQGGGNNNSGNNNGGNNDD